MDSDVNVVENKKNIFQKVKKLARDHWLIVTVLIIGVIGGFALSYGIDTANQRASNDLELEQGATPIIPMNVEVAKNSDRLLETDPKKLGYQPGEILIRFKPGVSENAIEGILNRYDADEVEEISELFIKKITVAHEAQAAVIEALSNNPLIDFVEENQLMEGTFEPNDPYWSSQWGQQKVEAPTAWDTERGVSETVIAVLDTGVDLDHPDLQSKITSNGYDTYNNDSDPSDDHGHGTAATGVSGAISDNSEGVASYCHGCAIMPVKVMGSDSSGTWSAVAKGIIHAADNGADVINLSLGGTGNSTSVHDAVKYARSKNVVIVASAGNYNSTSYLYPAAYPEVIGVASSNSDDSKSSYSSYGSWVSVAAPGSHYTTRSGGSYGYFSGTSSAAPAVSGLVGLLKSAKPEATVAEMETAIFQNTDSVSFEVEHGRINARKALGALLGTELDPTPTDTEDPSLTITSPLEGATLSGSTTVEADATDNVGVNNVELYVDNNLVARDNLEPYSFYLDTTAYSDGAHTITLTATDEAGNSSSQSVSVQISNASSDTEAPSVTISQPSDGASVSGNVTIAGNATDNVRISGIELYINGKLEEYSNTDSISFTWNTDHNRVKGGSYTIKLVAYDTSNNTSETSVVVEVTKTKNSDKGNSGGGNNGNNGRGPDKTR